MANYNTVITNEGAALLASVIANHGTITFTDLKLSENDYTGQETTMTAGTFDGVFADVVVASSIVDITTIKVSATVHGYNISGDHNLYALGVIGTDGNTTALIAICTTTNPDVLRDNSSTYAFNINLTVSSTSNITVVGTTAAALYTTDIVDNLTSTATDKPLSANMGKKLADEKQDKTLATPITVDGTQETTVEGALGALNDYGDSLEGNIEAIVDVYSAKNLWDIEGWLNRIGQPFTKSGNIYTTSITDARTNTNKCVFSDTDIEVTLSAPLTASGSMAFYVDLFDSNDQVVGGISLSQPTFTGVGCKVRFNFNSTGTVTLTEPMIRDARITDPTFAPYAKTNLQLTNDKAERADLATLKLTGSTNTTGAQIDAGTFFYLNGQFCKALTNIAVNATFTENTNYKKDTVGEELKKWTLIASATADGVKTWAQMISEISSQYPATEPYKYIIVKDNSETYRPMGRYSFVIIDGADTNYASIYVRMISLASNKFFEANGTLTPTDYSSNILTSGQTMQLYKIA